MIGASYRESGLREGSVNSSSGAFGLFQLLSSGYVKSYQSYLSQGVNPSQANINAILSNYVSSFRANPNAAPGFVASQVEASGMSGAWYAQGISEFLSKLSAGGYDSISQFAGSHSVGFSLSRLPGEIGTAITSAPGQVTGATEQVASAVEAPYNAAVSVEKFLGKLANPYLWLRVAEVVGGALLIGLALYLIAKDMGLAPGRPPGAAGRAVDEAEGLSDAFDRGRRQGEQAQARAAGRASAGAVVTGSETPRSARYTQIRERARAIPSDDIPF
jgi:hypothetical protein